MTILKWLGQTNSNPTEKSELIQDAMNGDLDRIELLLSTRSAPKRRPSLMSLSGEEALLDVNAEDGMGRTALHWAANRGHLDCVEKLLQVTDKIIQDNDGRTALHEAAFKGHNAIVNKILESERMCHIIDVVDHRKRTALHWALENGQEEVFKSLLQHGADALKEDGCKETAFLRAARTGNYKAAQIFWKHAFTINTRLFEAFAMAGLNNHTELARLIYQKQTEVLEDDVQRVLGVIKNTPNGLDRFLIWTARWGFSKWHHTDIV
ncbi:hypothetical protein J3459_011908 [Metarhizium acridum]|nr:hypothetical protein J3459_011908 [Metarhizium acridum]